jgi:uncharacterized Fe-S cluster-containing protein
MKVRLAAKNKLRVVDCTTKIVKKEIKKQNEISCAVDRSDASLIIKAVPNRSTNEFLFFVAHRIPKLIRSYGIAQA